MGLDVTTYACIGYKLQDTDIFYTKIQKPFKNPCCEDNYGKSRFCPYCGTNISLREIEQKYKPEYRYDKFESLRVLDSTDGTYKILCADYIKIDMDDVISRHIQMLDIHNISSIKEKIKSVLEKHDYPFSENDFGCWLIMNISR